MMRHIFADSVMRRLTPRAGTHIYRQEECIDESEELVNESVSSGANKVNLPSLQAALHALTAAPIERWHRAHWPKLEARGVVADGRVQLAASPEQFLVAVAGGDGGHHATYCCTFGRTWSVSRAFVLDADQAAGEACALPGAGG